jgi:uncharacterized protein YhaN
MKITDLEIDGFGVWNNLKLANLSRRVTAICGPNEAGKTTVMQFLRSVLYGVTPSRRKRYLPPVEGGRPGGTLGLVEGDLAFRATRYAERGPDDLGRVTCTTPDGVTGGDRLLREALGDVDEQTFTNVFAVTLSEVQELGTLSGSRAAEWLFRLTSGIDRVSLHDVMQQLREQRGSLLAEPGKPSRIVELSAQREKLRSEVDRLRDQYRQWSQLAVRIKELDEQIAKAESDVRQAEHEARTVEIAVGLKPNWLKREKLGQQLVLLSGRVRLPDDAVERLNGINADIEKHQRQADVLQGQRHQLRDEAERLGVNELLVRNASRIDALGEQRDWLQALLRQRDDLEREAKQCEAKLATEQQRLSEALGLRSGQRLRELSEDDLAQLQPHIDALRAAQKRFDQAQREYDGYTESERSLKTQIESAILGGQSHGLPMDLEESSDLVARLRKRLAVEQRLDQARQHEIDLEQQSHDLLDDQVMPLWLFGWLLATFIVGALMLGVWALVPNSPLGKYGGLVALIGVGGAAFAWVFKYFFDDERAERLDACQRQIEVVAKQIAEAEREKKEVDAELPITDGSVVLRLQAAERHLAELENMLPVEAQRKQAGGEVLNAEGRMRQAQRERDAALAEWRSAIVAMGLPETLDPQRLLAVTDRFAQLGELESRARHRREDAAARDRDYEMLTRRIHDLAEEVGCALPPSREESAPVGERRREHDRDDQRREETHRREETARREEERRTDREANRERDRERQRRGDREQHQQTGRRAESETPRESHLSLASSLASSADQRQPQYVAVRAPAMAQLDHLLTERRKQIGAIQRREELGQRARELKAEEAKHLQAIAGLKRRRSAMFQAVGCDDEQQYRMMAADQHQATLLGQQRDAVTREILAAIGRHEPEDVFASMLAPESLGLLDSQWERASGRLDERQALLKELAQKRGELNREQATLAEDRTLAERQLDLSIVEKQLAEARQSWREHAAVGRVLERIRADYEAHRQPETLSEASRYMAKLTSDQYRRIWTPLSGDCLLVETAGGESLPVDVLSRGTREQLFLSVRLALVANYARRGVNLPMVLDDVLVNFDLERTRKAAEVLCEFAAAGHQLLVFTCHDHMWEIFRKLDADCRRLPSRRGRPEPAPVPVEEVVETPPVEPIVEPPKPPKPRKRRIKTPVVVQSPVDWYEYPFVERVIEERPAPQAEPLPAFQEYSFDVEPPTETRGASPRPLAFVVGESHSAADVRAAQREYESAWDASDDAYWEQAQQPASATPRQVWRDEDPARRWKRA